jgi:DNA ligase-1
LTEQAVARNSGEFNKFFNRVVNEGLEGLMAKKSDSIYQAGARNFNWVKFKVGMTKELSDTIDCVVMGYYKGLGKRNEFGIGAFLVGIPDREKILTVSKIGTGLTDLQWREMYKRIEKIKVSQKPKEYIVNKNLYPDVWCEPKLVVEIKADTITKSPIHTAGLALRFPRLKNFRDDKDINQATHKHELEKIQLNK